MFQMTLFFYLSFLFLFTIFLYRLDKWKQMKDLYGVSMTSLEPLTKDALTGENKMQL